MMSFGPRTRKPAMKRPDTVSSNVYALTTHEVSNQPPALENRSSWNDDRPLRDAVTHHGAGWATDELAAFGTRCGRADVIALGLRRQRAATAARDPRPLRSSAG